MVLGPLRLTKSQNKLVTTLCEGAAAVVPPAPVIVFFSLMVVFFTGDGGFGRWILFAEGSSGGAAKNGFSGGGFWSSAVAPSNVGLAVAVTAMAGIAVAATVVYSRRGSLRSPLSRWRRKNALQPKQWHGFFTPEGRLCDGGIKFLKKVRSGGVDPSIRPEVWPFLLGVFDLNSSKEERDSALQQKRKEYESLRKQCRQTQKRNENESTPEQSVYGSNTEDSSELSQVVDYGDHEDVSSRRSISMEESEQSNSDSVVQNGECEEKSMVTSEDASASDSDSSEPESLQETETSPLLSTEESGVHDIVKQEKEKLSLSKPKTHTDEDFATWQRIIRLDAVRANDEWVLYSPSQAAVSETKARQLAIRVSLKDYEHLEPCRIYHAARLVAILEAYAIYDPEIGYCQGMSDLLSPIIAVIEDDVLAFWCFVGFMRKARHNFRLDEVGIRTQLTLVSKIIKSKDIHLYRHLEKLQAEDCFFVYRMVVVLFRRELRFEQTVCLWEVMWADQAAIRAGIAKHDTWGRIRLGWAPPTEDLLLYAIAASVLQRRKTIIEKYFSMDEIMRECNSMAGHLDVWKLLDDAHDLVAHLHHKI
ncbi:PREDICTED: GTPase-activating protein gyp7 [Tarenaya hassleriana]|uniref:GTPase-activating protein gyp7 n=1 Tax=Tarenaya hassleriana TaxID=28532 RepID=UPI00053C60A2|nr:PREDICTED: GTPase-activating protein gyp7 [Tarenaya hassleriana]